MQPATWGSLRIAEEYPDGSMHCGVKTTLRSYSVDRAAMQCCRRSKTEQIAERRYHFLGQTAVYAVRSKISETGQMRLRSRHARRERYHAWFEHSIFRPPRTKPMVRFGPTMPSERATEIAAGRPSPLRRAATPCVSMDLQNAELTLARNHATCNSAGAGSHLIQSRPSEASPSSATNGFAISASSLCTQCLYH